MAINIRNDIKSISHKTILLCGLVLLALVMSVGGVVKSSENNGEELTAEEASGLVKQKREEIKQVQNTISGYQTEIKNQQKQARTLQRDLAIYSNRIKKNELETKETRLTIEQTGLEIGDMKEKMENNEKKIEEDKEVLREFIRLLYSYEQDSMIEVLITKNDISDFFNEISAADSIRDKIFKTIINLRTEKEELKSKITESEELTEQQYQLIQMKFAQSEELEELKVQKKELLEVTKGEEEQFQKLLEENKSILPALKAQLHKLQSLGQKIKFDDAISAAQYIGAITDVRPAYLLGILRVESSLGTNVGGGTYKVDMRARQRPVFEAITAELGYNPDEMPVSKRPRNYKGWGGAMGPAQMMPTTWMVYKDRVSEITGNYPPDPWDLTDAIASMAIKVSGISGVTEGNYDAEYKAAGMYFAGRNWKRYPFYPNRVMLFADLYSKELSN